MNQFPVSISPRIATLLAGSIVIASSVVSPIHAVDKPQPTSAAKPDNSPDSAASNAKSVEALAELSRSAVVSISYSGRNAEDEGLGSGFVVSTNGLIATSLHVIGEARPITVQLANGKRHEVTEVHAWDRKLDLAVIRIDAENLTSLPLGDSDALKQGASVVAMGHPLGLTHSIVQGVVSARRDFDGVEMIQLAIPIEQGNSGGPMLDMQGRVHGILTMKAAVTANLGFAMPINALKRLLDKPNPVPLSRWLTIGALNPKEWSPLFGARWTQNAGRIQADGLGKGFGGRTLCLSQRAVPKRPYELAVTVRLADESGAAGLVFGSDGDQKHYGFYPSAGQMRLTRFDGPNVFSWTILEQVPAPAYRPGEWNQLKVRVDHERIQCFVNGQLVIESTDQQLPDGKIGLTKFRLPGATFKNFQMGTEVNTGNAVSTQAVAEITQQIKNFSGKPDASFLETLRKNAAVSQNVLNERARQLEQEAMQLRSLASTVHQRWVQNELTTVFKGPEERVDLFRAALLVAKLDDPELDLDAYESQLTKMADEIKENLPADVNDSQRLDRLRKFLFAENGFHGSRTDYYNRANSYINQVMDDREGLPITLSVLFIELASRIGLTNVFGVALPGHFIVEYLPSEGPPQWIDVFDGGRSISRAMADPLATGTGNLARNAPLEPARKREIIVRMLRNLARSAQETETSSQSLRYLDLIVALAPNSPAERLDRAMLRLRSGDQPGAKQDFKWILDNQPPGLDLDRVAEFYRSL